MSADLYTGRILELAADIPHVGTLADADGAARKVSRLCGSQVDVTITLQDDRILNFAIEPKACALGQASASVLARHALGASVADVTRARDQLAAMLRQNGPPPDGRFWELRYLEPVRDYAPRHASVLLAFEAAVAALEDAQAKAGDTACKNG